MIEAILWTAATVRSSSSNPRIEMNSGSFRSYDSSGNVLVEIPTSGNPGMLVLTAHDLVPGKVKFGSVADIYSGAASAESNAMKIEPQSTGKYLVIGGANDWDTIHLYGTKIYTDGDEVNFGDGSAAMVRVVPSSSTIKALDLTDGRLKLAGSGGLLTGVQLKNTETGSVFVEVASGGIGFYGATPISKPTVSGSKGGNAALADLLTELANLGLITDSTT